MRRKLLPLLSVFALLLVAVGGVAAAGHAGTDVDSIADDDVGICPVGADSPCNDAADDRKAGDDDQVFLPEDRDGDGEIDDRFRGDDEEISDGEPDNERGSGDEETDAGICLVDADSPCNGEPADGQQQASNDATEGDQAGTLEDVTIVDRLAALLGVTLPFVGGV